MKNNKIVVWMGLSFVSMIFIAVWAIGLFYFDSRSANVGDRASAIESLFSGLGLIGLLATLYFQRNELVLQREELRLTRQEDLKSSEAQQKSEKALTNQAKSLLLSARLNAIAATLSVYENRHALAMSRGIPHHIRLAELQREKFRMALEAIGEEIIYFNQYTSFNAIFAIVTLCDLMKTRIMNELSFIQQNCYDDFQFMILFVSVEQQVLAVFQDRSEFSPGVKEALSALIRTVIESASQLTMGRISSLENCLANGTRIIAQLDVVKSQSDLALAARS